MSTECGTALTWAWRRRDRGGPINKEIDDVESVATQTTNLSIQPTASCFHQFKFLMKHLPSLIEYYIENREDNCI